MRGEAGPSEQIEQPQVEPERKKKLPPFAQFLGDMFRGDEAAEAGPEPQVAEREEVASSPVVPAGTVLASAPPPAAQPPATSSQPADFREPLPVVVAAEVVTSTPPAKQEPPAQSATTPPATQPEPTVASDQLDEHTRSPWGASQTLLQQAKQNSAGTSTTLTRSLDLALENFRRDNSSQAPASSQIQTPEEVAKTEPVSIAPSEDAPDEGAENPLRVAQGKTDWSGRSLRANPAPQTILNSTAASYPQAAAEQSKWAIEVNEEASESASVEAKAPAATPQITVNPYADAPAPEAKPTAPSSPQVVTNPMVTPATEEKEAENATDAIHFESSLLGKLQAANQQAAWDFTKVEHATEEATSDDAITAVEETTNDELPQIVGPTDQSAEATVAVSRNSQPSVTEPADEAASLPIQPYVLTDPRVPTLPPRGTVVRPVPQVVNNPSATASGTESVKLPPVVRASQYQGPTPVSSSRGTKVYVIESNSP